MVESFEMADPNDTESVVNAAQRSVLKAMKNVIADVKRECGGPGMTWAQIEYLMEGFEKKEPTIIHQEEPV